MYFLSSIVERPGQVLFMPHGYNTTVPHNRGKKTNTNYGKFHVEIVTLWKCAKVMYGILDSSRILLLENCDSV